MADSHGNKNAVRHIFEKTREEADMYVHLGDGLTDLDDIRAEHPELDIRTVVGNCDYGIQGPQFNIIKAGKYNLYIAHGHMLRVNYGIDFIRKTAAGYNCKIVIGKGAVYSEHNWLLVEISPGVWRHVDPERQGYNIFLLTDEELEAYDGIKSNVKYSLQLS